MVSALQHHTTVTYSGASPWRGENAEAGAMAARLPYFSSDHVLYGTRGCPK